MGAGTSQTINQVVAIDFGTSNSGYAYCPGKGHAPIFDSDPTWKEGRTSTDILMDYKMEEILVFGPMASKSYRKSYDLLRKADPVVFSVASSKSSSYFENKSRTRIRQQIPVYDDPVLLEKIKLQVLSLTVSKFCRFIHIVL